MGTTRKKRPAKPTRKRTSEPKRPRTWRDVLLFDEKVSRATVRKYYDQYREENGLPRRCDNPACCFHTGELVWNGKELRLTLDHIKGVSRGHRPKNLQLLCPNCESQTKTRGGKNKGRVEMNTYLGALRRQRVPLEA
jgi:5-methylcytosine-specific restriction endonuclease McrA